MVPFTCDEGTITILKTKTHLTSRSGPPHLGVDLRERRPQFVRLPPQDDGFRGRVQRRHLHRHPGGLQDLLQGVALRTDDVLVLGLLHLHRDGRGLPLLQKQGEK